MKVGYEPISRKGVAKRRWRFTAKTLARESKKCDKKAVTNKKKCKKCMERGDNESARIFAEAAIRDKNQALNYLRLSARIDAVSQRVQTAVSMNMLTKNMGGVVKSMDTVMKTMDAERIMSVMDKFEKQFEDLDISTQFMENSMQQSTSVTMPESQVEGLMHQVADEHGLEFESELTSIGGGPVQVKEEISEKKLSEEQALEERLKRLQGL